MKKNQKKSIKKKSNRRKPIKRKLIKKKTIKRKSIKRKSIKRKFIKRKFIKRKSIKRKFIKRKSIKKKFKLKKKYIKSIRKETASITKSIILKILSFQDKLKSKFNLSFNFSLKKIVQIFSKKINDKIKEYKINLDFNLS